ncbi:MAG: hypothetical protein ACJAXY_002230 [Nonlabens sp.]|jgi:hypothetical protein
MVSLSRKCPTELLGTFNNALINNKELAVPILKALYLDEKSIDQIVK